MNDSESATPFRKADACRGGSRMIIGVVVPTYNRADLLPQTLDTIRAQRRPADEIVVVDDGSTDETASILARYAELIPLRTVRVSNGGDLAARNAGLKVCTADLVAFCDSDDLWTPDHLQLASTLLVACPEVTAVYTDFRVVRAGIWENATKFSQAPASFWAALELVTAVPGGGIFRDPMVAWLLDFQPFFPSAMVVRRAPFIAAGGWDEGPGRTLGGDFATALRMAEHPHLGILLHATVGIRKHRENRSGDVQRMNLGDSEILEHVLRSRAGLRPYAAAINASVLRRRIDALHSAFARRDFRGVSDIVALIPPGHQDRLVRTKAAVATLPKPFRGLLARVLLTAGSLRQRGT